MENRMIALAAVFIAAFTAFLGWCLWQWEVYILTSAAFWSLENFVLFSLGAAMLALASVPVVFALQPLLGVAALVCELVYQLVKGLVRFVRFIRCTRV